MTGIPLYSDLHPFKLGPGPEGAGPFFPKGAFCLETFGNQCPLSGAAHLMCQVWESSVRATHHFLSEEDIRSLAVYVPQALAQVPVLVVAFSDQGIPVGFMGIDGTRLEMLFLSPDVRGTGLGPAGCSSGASGGTVSPLCASMSRTLKPSISISTWVFRSAAARRPDEQGNPFPLLCMSRRDRRLHCALLPAVLY